MTVTHPKPFKIKMCFGTVQTFPSVFPPNVSVVQMAMLKRQKEKVW